MKTGFFTRLTAFVLLAISSFPNLTNAEQKTDPSAQPFRVGIILPLTGDTASIGTAVKNGIELAYSKFSDDEKKKLQLFFEDDGFIPNRSVAAYSKLRSFNNIDLLVNVGSQTSKALSSLAEKDLIPFVAIASDTLVSANKKYVVNFWVTPDVETKEVIPEAIRRGYKKIARISSVHDFSLAVKESFNRQNNGQIKISLDEEYPMDIKDFKPYLNKLKRLKDVDAVLAVLLPGQLGIFAKQAREFGITQPLFGYEIFEDPSEVKLSNGALIGQWYVNAADPTSGFLSEYTAKYPNAALFGAANGHDVILMINEAIKTSTKRVDVNNFLHTVKEFKGALGTFSALADNTFALPASLKVVTESGFKAITADENQGKPVG